MKPDLTPFFPPNVGSSRHSHPESVIIAACHPTARQAVGRTDTCRKRIIGSMQADLRFMFQAALGLVIVAIAHGFTIIYRPENWQDGKFLGLQYRPKRSKAFGRIVCALYYGVYCLAVIYAACWTGQRSKVDVLTRLV